MRTSETAKAYQKSERKIKELQFQADEDAKNQEKMGELATKLQEKIRTYKKQIEDAEEIAALNLAKFRKAQQVGSKMMMILVLIQWWSGVGGGRGEEQDGGRPDRRDEEGEGQLCSCKYDDDDDDYDVGDGGNDDGIDDEKEGWSLPYTKIADDKSKKIYKFFFCRESKTGFESTMEGNTGHLY